MECPSCGNENREGARFCDSCGAVLAEAPSEAAPAAEPAAPTALPPGSPTEVAGRYRVTGFLGQGGRKRVFLAEDSEGRREVAVAVFDTEGATAAIGARARREAQAMGKLAGHAHIVDVYDAGDVGGNPFIVSEYMPGGDVEGLLDAEGDRRLPISRAIEIATDVSRGLEHAHGRGIVHRDIKPANVWLGEDGKARLGDFGLATTEGRSRVSESGTLVGTVAYLPPEQAVGAASGPRSDLYSLGALLYEMLTGQPPYSGDDAVSIISQHLNADPVPVSRANPEVPRVLDELVTDLLAKRPEDRPQGAAEVRERLAEAASAPPASEEADAAAGANPLDSLAGGVFVGREQEVEELRGELAEALAGRGRLVLVNGEPGIGKTRTSEELATYAQLRGARVLWGRCREDEGAPAYWPWVQAIRSYVRDADPVALAWQMGAGTSEIAHLVPEAAERAGQTPKPFELEGEEARFRLFDAVTSFLTTIAADRPLVIVLDDLHWADEPSLKLLEFAARELSGSGLLILGTYRDVELGRHHPLAGTISELEGTRRITLRGLDPEGVARYVEMVAGIKPAPELAEAIHSQTEGNPFFLSEVVRLLASEGQLTEEAPAGSSWRVAIPQGVREVVGRRLDRLSKNANEALTVAAAIGREFDAELGARVSDLGPEELREAAEEAMRARLIVKTPTAGRWAFDHALVRETLYEELSPAQRAKLHAKIAAAMEDYPEGSEAPLGELAHHYLQAGTAGDPEKAIDYAVLAAGKASEQLAHEEAAELYEDALEVVELAREPDEQRRLQLLLALGEAQASSGQFPRSRDSLDKAVETARKVGDGSALIEAALGLGRVTVVGQADEKIIETINEALEACEEGDSANRAGLLSALSTEELWIDLDRARELALEALEMARRVGDPQTLAGAIHRQLIMEQQPDGSSEHRLELLDEMQAVAEANDFGEFLTRAHAFRVREYLELGEIQKADREIDAYTKVAEELRMPQHLWHVPLFGAMRALIDGELKAAEELTNEAAAGGRRAGEPLSEQFVGIQAAQLRRLQGRADELLPVFRQMTERFPAIPAWRTALAAALAQANKVDEARVEFERIAARDFGDIPRDAQFRSAIALISEVCVAVGDAKRAEFLYEQLAPVSGLAIVVGRAAMVQGPYDRILGLLAEAHGDREAAVGHFEDAIRLTERMGDRPMLAWTKADYASALLGVVAAAAGRDAEPSEADRDKALSLLAEAIDVGRQIGAPGLVDRALGLRLEAQGLAGVDITTSIDDVISAVESERPDLRAHAAPDGSVTILFSDIEDSTILTERLGDERWLEVLREHNSIFREQIATHDGYEVKNQGDGFMLAFPDPRRALECAIEVQRAFAQRAADGAEDAMRIRMGLHAGEVIAEEGDFFGKNVILAARIAAKATGGEILVSSSLKDKASEGDDGEPCYFDEGRELELKGLAGKHLVFRADWEAQTAAA